MSPERASGFNPEEFDKALKAQQENYATDPSQLIRRYKARSKARKAGKTLSPDLRLDQRITAGQKTSEVSGGHYVLARQIPRAMVSESVKRDFQTESVKLEIPTKEVGVVKDALEAIQNGISKFKYFRDKFSRDVSVLLFASRFEKARQASIGGDVDVAVDLSNDIESEKQKTVVPSEEPEKERGLKQQKSELETKERGLNSEISDLSRQITARESNIISVRQEIKARRQALEDSQKRDGIELTKEEKDQSRYETEVTDLESSLAYKQKQLKDLEAKKRDNDEYNRLQSELGELKDKLDNLREKKQTSDAFLNIRKTTAKNIEDLGFFRKIERLPEFNPALAEYAGRLPQEYVITSSDDVDAKIAEITESITADTLEKFPDEKLSSTGYRDNTSPEEKRRLITEARVNAVLAGAFLKLENEIGSSLRICESDLKQYSHLDKDITAKQQEIKSTSGDLERKRQALEIQKQRVEVFRRRITKGVEEFANFETEKIEKISILEAEKADLAKQKAGKEAELKKVEKKLQEVEYDLNNIGKDKNGREVAERKRVILEALAGSIKYFGEGDDDFRLPLQLKLLAEQTVAKAVLDTFYDKPTKPFNVTFIIGGKDFTFRIDPNNTDSNLGIEEAVSSDWLGQDEAKKVLDVIGPKAYAEVKKFIRDELKSGNGGPFVVIRKIEEPGFLFEPGLKEGLQTESLERLAKSLDTEKYKSKIEIEKAKLNRLAKTLNNEISDLRKESNKLEEKVRLLREWQALKDKAYEAKEAMDRALSDFQTAQQANTNIPEPSGFGKGLKSFGRGFGIGKEKTPKELALELVVQRQGEFEVARASYVEALNNANQMAERIIAGYPGIIKKREAEDGMQYTLVESDDDRNKQAEEIKKKIKEGEGLQEEIFSIAQYYSLPVNSRDIEGKKDVLRKKQMSLSLETVVQALIKKQKDLIKNSQGSSPVGRNNIGNNHNHTLKLERLNEILKRLKAN